MISASELAELRALAGKATPGEWVRNYIHVYAPGPSGANVCSAGEPRASTTVGYTPLGIGSEGGEEAYANAAFIAASREAIPKLLDAVEALAKQLAFEHKDYDHFLRGNAKEWKCGTCNILRAYRGESP